MLGAAAFISIVNRTMVCMYVVLQVCRGTAVTMVAPTAGAEEIANPFLQQAEEQ